MRCDSSRWGAVRMPGLPDRGDAEAGRPARAGRGAAGRRRSRPRPAGGRAGGRLPRGNRRARGRRRGVRHGRVRLGADGGGRSRAGHRGRAGAGRQCVPDACTETRRPPDAEVLLALPGGARATALPPGGWPGCSARSAAGGRSRGSATGCWCRPPGLVSMASPVGGRGRAGRRGRALARRGAARQLDRALRLAGGRRAGDPGAPAGAVGRGRAPSAAGRGLGRPVP